MYSKEKKEKTREIVHQYKNYGIVGTLTLMVLFVFPLISANIGLETAFPKTTLGWIIWSTIRVCFIICNVMIFKSFVDQAEINVENNERYLKAKEIMRTVRGKTYIPMSPSEYKKKIYSKKVLTLVLTSATALFGISQAILSYNFIDLISYSISMIMAIVFGLMTMSDTECYWVEEFYDYAVMERDKNDSNTTGINDDDVTLYDNIG